MGETEEVFDVVLPADDQAAKVMKPGKKAFDPPSPAVSTQRVPVLGDAAVCGDWALSFQCRIVLQAERPACRNRKPCRRSAAPATRPRAARQRILYELAHRRRSAVNSNGEWKTVTSGDSDDLRALAPPRGANRKAPFFALAKVASTNASSRFSCPLSCRYRASARSAPSSLPLRTQD